MKKSLSVLALLSLLAATALAAPQTLDWPDLLPESQRGNYDPAPPPPSHDYLMGELSSLAAAQVMDFKVNEQLSGREVRLPGFIVPLELDDKGLVTEFFLVPYFGACIHVPPPPANQMVYVRMAKGISLDSMYAAYWVTGTMTVEARRTGIGAAAYTMEGNAIEEYRF